MAKIPSNAKQVGGTMGKTPIIRTIRRSDGAGYVQQVVGYRTGFVQVWVDVDNLIRTYAGRALRNKYKTSVLGGGSIVLKAVDIRDIDTLPEVPSNPIDEEEDIYSDNWCDEEHA